jgi:hypothetical protein
MPPNNSLMLTQLADEKAAETCLPSPNRMKEASPSRRAAPLPSPQGRV